MDASQSAHPAHVHQNQSASPVGGATQTQAEPATTQRRRGVRSLPPVSFREGEGRGGGRASLLCRRLALPNWNAAGSADAPFPPPKRPTDILMPPASDLQRPKTPLLLLTATHRSMERRRARERARRRLGGEGNRTELLLRLSVRPSVCLTVSALQSAADCS